MQEEFEFIVFNTEALSADPVEAKKVTEACRALAIPTIEVMRDQAIEMNWIRRANLGNMLFRRNGRFMIGKGGYAFNYMLQWAWEKVISKQTGPIAFVHTDVFLIEPIKLTDYLKDYDLRCVINHQPNRKHPEEGEISYMWEALLLANMPKMPNADSMVWFPDTVEGSWTDTGGPTHYYMKAHPEVRILPTPQTGVEDDPAVDFHPARYQYFHLDDKRVFHYQSGSKWCTDMNQYWNFTKERSDEYHAKKLAWTRRLVGLEGAQ